MEHDQQGLLTVNVKNLKQKKIELVTLVAYTVVSFSITVTMVTQLFGVFSSQAKTQKVQQEKAASKILAGTQNIKGLEEKLQVGFKLFTPRSKRKQLN